MSGVVLSNAQVWDLFLHFLSLSVLATGGAVALAADMHRYVVDQHAYLSHTQFVNSIALAQASPGPNLLFVTVMGWQIAGLQGALATTLGLSLPSLVFPFMLSRLGRHPSFERAVKALQGGLSPIAIGLMASTCYLLARDVPGLPNHYTGAAIIVVTIAVLAFTRIPPVLMIFAAGALGAVVPW